MQVVCEESDFGGSNLGGLELELDRARAYSISIILVLLYYNSTTRTCTEPGDLPKKKALRKVSKATY